MIVDRDRENLLGALLPNYVLIEYALDLGRLGHRRGLAEGFLVVGFFRDDVVTKIDAFVADIDRGTGDQFAYFVLTLAAERAHQVARAVIMLGHVASHGSLGGPPANDYLINQSIFNRLFWREEHIAIGVLLNLLQLLSRMTHDDPVEFLADPQNLARLNIDIGCLSLRAAERLMNHDARMGQGIAPSLLSRQQQQRAHARRLPET